MTDRKYCRLCLKSVQAGLVLEEYQSTRAKLIKLFPGMNLNLTYTLTLCLECLKSVKFISDVVDKGIKMQQLGLSKPYLKNDFELCNVCFNLQDLKLTSVTRSSQVADLQKIIAVALFPLNSSERSEVIVCNQCWYWIQKMYNYKKQCFEVEQSLTLYRQQHNLAVLNDTDVEDFVKNKMHTNTNLLRQGNKKISGITTHDNNTEQNKSTELISECCSEDTVSVIEEPDIECLKFEADETVILNTIYNDDNLVPSESSGLEITEDDVFVEDCTVANADSDHISIDNCSDNESTDLVLIENDVADFTPMERFGPSHQRRFPSESLCYGCYVCETKFFHKRSVVTHILTHETPKNKLGKFKCPFCPFRSSSKGSVTVHKSTHKKCNKEKFANCLVYYYCAFCNTTFESKTETQLHIGEHVKNFRDFWCTECIFSTDSPQRLRVHFMGSHNRFKDRSFSLKQKYN